MPYENSPNALCAAHGKNLFQISSNEAFPVGASDSSVSEQFRQISAILENLTIIANFQELPDKNQQNTKKKKHNLGSLFAAILGQFFFFVCVCVFCFVLFWFLGPPSFVLCKKTCARPPTAGGRQLLLFRIYTIFVLEPGRCSRTRCLSAVIQQTTEWIHVA